MNIQSAINEASLKLKKNNIASPLIDSEILMTKVLNKKREYVILNIEKKLKQKDFDYFKDLVNQRLNGKPIAYITGQKYFNTKT